MGIKIKFDDIIMCLLPISATWHREYRFEELIPWSRHQMKIYSALLALCAEIHRSPVNSPYNGQWRRALVFSLIRALNKRLSKQAGDLRRQRGHYDVIVMFCVSVIFADCKKLRKLLDCTDSSIASSLKFINTYTIKYSYSKSISQ